MALLEEFKQWESGVWTHNGGEFEHDPMLVVPDPSDSSKFCLLYTSDAADE